MHRDHKMIKDALGKGDHKGDLMEHRRSQGHKMPLVLWGALEAQGA